MGQDSWPDIPGLTLVDGVATLPRNPAEVVELLARLAQEEPPPRWSALAVDERGRGLLAWAKGSRVLGDVDGRVARHPELDVADLATRFAARCGAARIAPEAGALRDRFVREVARLAVDRLRRLGPPTHEGTWPLAPTAPEPAETGGREPPWMPRLRTAIAWLEGSFAEREGTVRLAVLCLLSGQHLLLLGPPGTAKSALARGVCALVEDARYFDYLLTRFTHPDELFGPISVPALRDEDYRRVTEGFLPSAHVVFLDEVFKASSAILNALLTLVNERRFHHGRHRDIAPLVSLVGASNEEPADEGLSALWDRFLVRVEVGPVVEEASFLRVALGAEPTPLPARLSLDDVAVIRAAAERVLVPVDVQGLLVTLWREATERSWGVSDRRWRQAVWWLRVAAAAEGRAAVRRGDLLLLDAVLAPRPEVAPEVRQVLGDVVAGEAVVDDLDEQWLLLRFDRVAPTHRDVALGHRADSLGERLARRRQHLGRFRSHLADAVQALRAQRAALADEGGLWRPSPGHRWLAEHAARAGRLARFEHACRLYEATLSEPVAAVVAAWDAWPRERRAVPGPATLGLGLRVAGVERRSLTLVADGADVRVRERDPRDATPVLDVELADWVAFVTGGHDGTAWGATLPAWSRRAAIAALHALRESVQRDPLPPPPEP